jgi:hypothetical protein
MRKLLRMYYNKDGNDQTKKISYEYLTKENMYYKYKKIKDIFEEYWNLKPETKLNMIDQTKNVINNIILNIKNYKEQNKPNADNLGNSLHSNNSFDNNRDALSNSLNNSDNNIKEESTQLQTTDRYIYNPYLNIQLTPTEEKELLGFIEKNLIGLFNYQLIKIPPESAFTYDSNDKEVNDISIYIGTGSSLYYYWRYYLFCKSTKKGKRIKEALYYYKTSLLTNIKLIENEQRCGSSFFLSPIGIYTLGCIYYLEINDITSFNDCLNIIIEQSYSIRNEEDEHELLYGTTGYLYALLLIKKECYSVYLGNRLDQIILDLIKFIHSEGLKYRNKLNAECLIWPFPKNNKEDKSSKYLGGAHGSFGVIYILLSAIEKIDYLIKQQHNYLQILLSDIRSSLYYFLNIQFTSGNFPFTIGNSEDKLLFFCHGSPGSIPLLLKSYELYGDKEFLEACLKAGEDLWIRGLLLKGNNLCHGICGNAYFFHSIYRVTNDLKWKNRFLLFAKACYDERIQSLCREYKDPTREVKGMGDRPYSIMEGEGGIICLYSDTLSGKIVFPGYEI